MARRRAKAYLREGKGRFRPSRLISPVTRKEQPEAAKPMRVGRLVRRSYPMKSVSSTNVAKGGYDIRIGVLYIDFLSGSSYGYYVPFEIFEEFYYAHSKGTFVHRVLKGGRSKPPYPYDYFKVG